ncbi:MAG: ParA family protein [Azonexus sp.]
MASVITVFNQKGGCGKSMTTMQLAGCYALGGLTTLVIDMDPQGTALVWSKIKPAPALRLKATGLPFAVENLAPMGKKMVNAVKQAFDQYDVILIDTPPAVESEAPWAALQVSDLAIIPFIPTPADSWADEARLLSQKALRENQDLRGVWHLPSVFRRGSTIEGILESYREDTEIFVTKSVIHQRDAYLFSQACGLCVGQLPRSKGGAAADEMVALSVEIAKLAGFKLSKSKKGGK